MRKVTIFAITICLAASSLFFSACTTRADWVDVEINENVFDHAKPVYNDNNNTMNGAFDNINLARTDDAFYFKKSETRSELKMSPALISDHFYKTIYRTDENGTKMVYDGKMNPFEYNETRMEFFEGKLLDYYVNYESGEQEFWCLNEDVRKFEKLFTFEAPNHEELCDYIVIGGKLYLFCAGNVVYEYSGGKYEKLPIEPTFSGNHSYVCDYDENGFFYYDSDSEKNVNEKILYRYDLDKRKTVAAYDLAGVKVKGGFSGYEKYSIITGNYLYIGLLESYDDYQHIKFYRVKLSDLTAQLIFETDEDICLNAVDGCAYIGFSENKFGLYKITPDSTGLIKLSDDPVSKIYIADDKWIYFSDTADIMRMTRDGKELETAVKVKTPN